MEATFTRVVVLVQRGNEFFSQPMSNGTTRARIEAIAATEDDQSLDLVVRDRLKRLTNVLVGVRA